MESKQLRRNLLFLKTIVKLVSLERMVATGNILNVIHFITEHKKKYAEGRTCQKQNLILLTRKSPEMRGEGNKFKIFTVLNLVHIHYIH